MMSSAAPSPPTKSGTPSHQQSQMFSYLSPETRVREDHPLRAVRTMVDEVLRALSLQFG